MTASAKPKESTLIHHDVLEERAGGTVGLLEKYCGRVFSRSGANQITGCPLCGSSDGLTVHASSPGHGHCYVCDETQDGIGWIQKMRGLSYPEALRLVEADFGPARMPRGHKRKPGRRAARPVKQARQDEKWLPPIEPFRSDEDGRAIARQRGDEEKLLLGVRAGEADGLFPGICYYPVDKESREPNSYSRACWALTDDSREAVSVRRLDGQPIFPGQKAHSFGRAGRLIGVSNLRARKLAVIVEGAGDAVAVLTMREMIEGVKETVAVFVKLSASSGISAGDVEALVSGGVEKVRILPQRDTPREFKRFDGSVIQKSAGCEAAAKWFWTLRDAGLYSDIADPASVFADGQKDWNDFFNSGGHTELDLGALFFGEGKAGPGSRRVSIVGARRPVRGEAAEYCPLEECDEKSAAAEVYEGGAPQQERASDRRANQTKSRGKKAVQKAAAAEPGGEGGAESGEGGGGAAEFDPAAVCERYGISCENRKERNWYARLGGELAPFSTGELGEYLFVRGEVKLRANREAGERVSEFARLKVYAWENRRVDYALPAYAGYASGVYSCGGNKILAMKSPDLIEPREGPWPTIQAFIRGLLPPDGDGMDQAEIFLSWLQLAVRAVRGEPRSGQLLILIGKKGDGKGRLQHFIITPLLGGRSADPIPFLLGESNFNDELIGTEHLLSEDPAASVKRDERNKFKQKLKAVAVNDTARFHPKHRPAVTLRPVWRMSISLNDGPDDLAILPPPSSDWTEKTIMLATKRPAYLPGAGEAERREWRDRLALELPCFLYYLLNVHETPEDYRGDRFGVVSFEAASIRAHLEEGAPWAQLLAEIDDWAPWTGQPGGYHKAKLHELEASLTSAARDNWQAMERLLKRHSLAYLLRQIMAEMPERVSKSRTGTKGGGRHWLLWCKEARQASSAAAVEAAESETQNPEASDEI